VKDIFHLKRMSLWLCFYVYQELLNLKFDIIPGAQVWHNDVSLVRQTLLFSYPLI